MFVNVEVRISAMSFDLNSIAMRCNAPGDTRTGECVKVTHSEIDGLEAIEKPGSKCEVIT